MNNSYKLAMTTFMGVTLYVDTPVIGVELRFSAVKKARAPSPGFTLTYNIYIKKAL